jgi:hypothetical protein
VQESVEPTEGLIDEPEPMTPKAKKPRSPKSPKVISITLPESTPEEPTPEQPIQEEHIQEQPIQEQPVETEPSSDLITCPCGSIVSKKSYAKHLKTKKHLQWMAAQETSSIV